MQQHGRKIFCRIPLPDPLTQGMASVGQTSTLSEHGHVTYQNKENHECSNMVANMLPKDPHTPRWGWGQ